VIGRQSQLYPCICLIQVQLHVHYILYFFLDNVSSTCFGCYLHPSSGAQLQRTAIGFVSVEVLVPSGMEPYFIWICVYSYEYLIPKRLFFTDTKPMAVRCSYAPDDACK
jgi:hypothetical protein